MERRLHLYRLIISCLWLQLVSGLKATGQYENTIIVFTTDNGGAISTGGNNLPLRGTKGTLYEGDTRAIGFVHSPLLKKTGWINRYMYKDANYMVEISVADPVHFSQLLDNLN